MKADKSKKLTPGDRVQWNDGALGTVKETNWMCVKIEWDDGQISVTHHDDMKAAEVAPNGAR